MDDLQWLLLEDIEQALNARGIETTWDGDNRDASLRIVYQGQAFFLSSLDLREDNSGADAEDDNG